MYSNFEDDRFSDAPYRDASWDNHNNRPQHRNAPYNYIGDAYAEESEGDYDEYGRSIRYEGRQGNWSGTYDEYAGSSSSQSRPAYDDYDHRSQRSAYHEPDLYDTSHHCQRDQYDRRSDRGPMESSSSSQPYRDRPPNHWRTPSPPPPVIPTSPSTEYLSASLELHQPVDLLEQRKLLILDLNGTLLVRSGASRRAVHPRPYMPSFRSYLFHDESRKWLDVMIWSSAQPHNVEKMVWRCFFNGKTGYTAGDGPTRQCGYMRNEEEDDKWGGKLIAVWARDTLGLTSHDYTRKSQTTKDLAKPWSLLPNTHSALTTMLLDDSPRKARLQPYNHVCIREYDESQRRRDLRLVTRILRKERERALELQAESLDTRETKVSDGEASTSEGANSTLSSDDASAGTETKTKLADGADDHPAEVVSDRSSRRKEKKERKKSKKELLRLRENEAKSESSPLPLSTACDPSSSSTSIAESHSANESTTNDKDKVRVETAAAKSEESLDETLLAVIGILDMAKNQANVASWVRHGGLWAPGRAPSVIPEPHSSTKASDNRQAEEVGRASSPTDFEVEDLLDVPHSDPAAPSEPSDSQHSPPSSSLRMDPSSQSHPSVDGRVSPASSERKRQRSATAEVEALPQDQKKTRPNTSCIPNVEDNGGIQIEVVPPGNDAESIGAQYITSPRAKPVELPVTSDSGNADVKGADVEEAVAPKMWFEDPETFSYWVSRGRASLKELDIEEIAGIEVD